MILLRHDCLVFKSPGGEAFPYSAEEVTLEIIGDAIDLLDEQTIKQASEAVLHYFKTELGSHHWRVLDGPRACFALPRLACARLRDQNTYCSACDRIRSRRPGRQSQRRPGTDLLFAIAGCLAGVSPPAAGYRAFPPIARLCEAFTGRSPLDSRLPVVERPNCRLPANLLQYGAPNVCLRPGSHLMSEMDRSL